MIGEPFLVQLKNFLKLAPVSKLGFTIGTLSHYNREENFYTTPVRSTSRITYMGVIVKNVETAVEIASMVEGKVAYVFVDTEKKIQKENYGPHDVGNIEKAISEELRDSKLLSYKANDLTVHAADSLIRVLTPNLTGTKIAIIGVSNIGMKLGLSLLERGNSVTLYSKNAYHAQSVAELLNKVKMRNVLVECSYETTLDAAIRDSGLIVSCSTGKSLIGIEELNQLKRSKISNMPLLIDVGKGGFKDEIIEMNYVIHRVDVGAQLSREIDNLLELESQCEKKAYRRINDEIFLVRSGIVGKKGDIVVDDPENPQRILGECDGNGNLINLDDRTSRDLINLCLGLK